MENDSAKKLSCDESNSTLNFAEGQLMFPKLHKKVTVNNDHIHTTLIRDLTSEEHYYRAYA